MDILQDLIEALASAARRVWPGVVVSALGGYLGWQWLGFLGFWTGAAAGALAGTWIGVKLDIVKVKAATGSVAGDQLLSASGAFAIVAAGYMLLQFIYIVLAVAAVVAIAVAWMSS